MKFLECFSAQYEINCNKEERREKYATSYKTSIGRDIAFIQLFLKRTFQLTKCVVACNTIQVNLVERASPL